MMLPKLKVESVSTGYKWSVLKAAGDPASGGQRNVLHVQPHRDC